MAKPDGYIPVGWTDIGHDELEARVVPWDGSVPRATIQRQFAVDADADFTDVACHVRYVRPLTYQEMWDEVGKERWADEENMRRKVGWYFKRHKVTDLTSGGTYIDLVPPAPGKYKIEVLDEGWYLDADGETPAQGVEDSDAPDIVPDDWVPGESDWTFEFVRELDGTYPTPVVRILYCSI